MKADPGRRGPLTDCPERCATADWSSADPRLVGGGDRSDILLRRLSSFGFWLTDRPLEAFRILGLVLARGGS